MAMGVGQSLLDSGSGVKKLKQSSPQLFVMGDQGGEELPKIAQRLLLERWQLDLGRVGCQWGPWIACGGAR